MSSHWCGTGVRILTGDGSTGTWEETSSSSYWRITRKRDLSEGRVGRTEEGTDSTRAEMQLDSSLEVLIGANMRENFGTFTLMKKDEIEVDENSLDHTRSRVCS